MFTNNWFEITGIKNFEKYVLPMKESGKEFLEIGCYEGRATLWMLENTKADITVIDTFEGSKEHDAQFETTLFQRFTDTIKDYTERVNIIKGTSREKLKSLELEHDGLILFDYFDFIYIDGSHQASDVLEDAVLAFPLLKEGGIMIFDDYTWGQGLDYYDIPAIGINAFLTVYGNQIEILEKNSQVIIRKPLLPPTE